MRIVLLCEGATEGVLKGALKKYLDEYCGARSLDRIGIDIKQFEGLVPKCAEVQRRFEHHARNHAVVGVIVLTDVRPKFENATQAKHYLCECVKDSREKKKFHAHAAHIEFEAWLLPFWNDIAERLKLKAKPPGSNPEQVNRDNPPSKRLSDLYKRAGRKYEKVIEAEWILKRHRIEDAAKKCPELQSLLETLTMLCDKCAA